MPSVNNYKRTRNLFNPQSKAPYFLSRSRLENFLRCPRCFYLDRRLGVDQPGMPAFTLNSAVDALLKKEFDLYRQKGQTHPLMERYGVKAVPFQHPQLQEWQEVFKGIRYHHQPTNLLMFGAIDDIWTDDKGVLYIVDFKSTSTSGTITLNGIYKEAYKRQMEIYQWLLRHNQFDVSGTGYFVYCNADRSPEAFEGRLEFDMQIIAYQGDSSWVESAIEKAHACLMSENLPEYSKNCEFCQYRQAVKKVEGEKFSHQEVQGELFL
ncbi:MAG: PD-(D/E)XK nuclease family protein [Candidatus Omnitrophota bacterium]